MALAAFVPAKPTGVATLYLHGVSMAKDAVALGGPIDALVRQGIVLTAELRGIGETETGHDKVNYGRGYFGGGDQKSSRLPPRSELRRCELRMWAAWTRFLRDQAPLAVSPLELHVVATGEAAIPALHAVALQPGDFRNFAALRGMINSWEEVVRAPRCKNQWVNTVHGVLRHYDLPDPLASAAKTR